MYTNGFPHLYKSASYFDLALAFSQELGIDDLSVQLALAFSGEADTVAVKEEPEEPKDEGNAPEVVAGGGKKKRVLSRRDTYL